MPDANYETLNAIILKEVNYNDFDVILTIYSLENGKMPVLVKGVKKQNNKMRSGIQLFSLSEFEVFKGKELAILTNVDVIENFSEIRQSYKLTMLSLYFMDLIDHTIELNLPDYRIFQHIIDSLALLQDLDPWLITIFFEWRLFDRLGYRINFGECSLCNKFLRKGQRKGIITSDNVFICNDCSQTASFLEFKIFQEEITFLESLSNINDKYLKYIRLTKEEKNKIENFMNQRINAYIGYELKSSFVKKQLIK